MRFLSRLSLVLLVALTACSGDGGDSANIARFDGEMPIQAPWVNHRLPRGTQAYQRIPHPLGLLAAPKGNMLDPALASEANVGNLLAIHEALVASLTADSGILDDPRARLLIEHLRSPVEVAATLVPLPTVLAGMTLDLRSNAEVEALFAGLAGYPQMPSLAGPLDDAGFADVNGLPVPALVNFDARTGRLALFGGPGANRNTLEGLLGPSGENLDHPMADLESQIDSSGQGFFSWLDTSELLALGSMALPPEAMAMLQGSGMRQLRSIAFGMGVADGKGRLKLVADVGTLSANRPFPVIENDIEATAVGEPRSLFLLSIPEPSEFRRLEDLALSYAPPEARVQWDRGKGSLTEAMGVSIEEIVDAVGPELIAFTDRAGSFTGLRVRDRALFEDVLSRLAAKAGTPIDERRVEGQTIRYVILPGFPGFLQEASAESMSPWLRMLSRMQSRSYWIEDDGYVYIASLPQPLIDRARLDPDTNIGDWLEETQRLDLSSSLLGASGTVANLPQKTYQAYLTTMQALADVVGAEHDIWSMPTAQDLDLPERGSVGISVNFGEPYLSAEISYESHPFEALVGGGGVAAAAVVGALAAVAIPAYQDYTIRAQVSEGLNLAAIPKAAIAEAYLADGSAPADREAAGLPADPAFGQGRYVQSIDIVDGAIVIVYGMQAHETIRGGVLALRPYETNGLISWVCGGAAMPANGVAIGGGDAPVATTIDPKYLPSACRPG